MEYYYHRAWNEVTKDEKDLYWEDLNNAIEFIKKAVPNNIIKFIREEDDGWALNNWVTEVILKLSKIKVEDREVIIDYEVSEVRDIILFKGKGYSKLDKKTYGAIIVEENLILYKLVDNPSSPHDNGIYECCNGFIRELSYNGRQFTVDFELPNTDLLAVKDNSSLDKGKYCKVDTIRVVVSVSKGTIEFRDKKS